MDNIKLIIPEFKGEGYLYWRKKVELALIASDMEDALLPPKIDTKAPEQITSENPDPKGKAADGPHISPPLSSFSSGGKSKHQKALALIQFALSPEIFKSVYKCNSVFDLLKTLDDYYIGSDGLVIANLLGKCFSLRFEHGTARDHILNANTMFDEIAARGYHLDQSMKCYILANSLPSRFNTIVSSFSLKFITEANYNAFQQAVINDDEQTTTRENHTNTQSAYSASTSNNNGTNSPSKARAATNNNSNNSSNSSNNNKHKKFMKDKNNRKGQSKAICFNCGSVEHNTGACQAK